MGITEERAVTVSLAYHRCRPLLRRAVESILGQTHGDLTLIVLNDGDDEQPWDLLADIRDDRLVRFDLDANRGRYFADAVALTATADRYFAVQDADDWSALDRIGSLYEVLRENNGDAAYGAEYTRSAGRREPRKVSYRACTERPPPQLRLLASHFGLFRARALRSIGGYYGGFRIGYDRLLTGLLRLTGRVCYLDEPLYNREVRADSLSSSSESGMSSAVRWEVRARLDVVYEQAYQSFWEYTAGRRSYKDLCRSIAALTQADVSPDDARALSAQSLRLRSELDNRRVRTQRKLRPLPTWSTLPRVPRDIRQSRVPAKPGRAAISVVIPTRHDTGALPATIGSFLEQRASDTAVEFVIVDDGSPSGVDCAALDERFDFQGRNAQIHVVRPPEHVGITRARNLGARCARGDRLFVTDAHVEVSPGWDDQVEQFCIGRRVLAATIVDPQTGAAGFGASLNVPAMSMSWNATPSGDPGVVQVAASAGMVVDRSLYWSLGGFDDGMLRYGSAEAEFSLRAWLRGAQVLNLPNLIVRHRFRSSEDRLEAFKQGLPFTLHNRLRFALLYLDDGVFLRLLRELAVRHPAPAVAQACDLVASSNVWKHRAELRDRELLSLGWFERKFGVCDYELA